MLMNGRNNNTTLLSNYPPMKNELKKKSPAQDTLIAKLMSCTYVMARGKGRKYDHDEFCSKIQGPLPTRINSNGELPLLLPPKSVI